MFADRHRTVSWNNSNPTGVVKPVYGIPLFPLTTKAVYSNGHTSKEANIILLIKTAHQSEEAITIIKTKMYGNQKYTKTSDRVGYAPTVWKRAQVQGMKES